MGASSVSETVYGCSDHFQSRRKLNVRGYSFHRAHIHVQTLSEAGKGMHIDTLSILERPESTLAFFGEHNGHPKGAALRAHIGNLSAYADSTLFQLHSRLPVDFLCLFGWFCGRWQCNVGGKR